MREAKQHFVAKATIDFAFREQNQSAKHLKCKQTCESLLSRKGERQAFGETVENVFRRYGRAQFIRDAVWIGLTAENAFSRVELRRQRDRLMIVHHPDHGGDAEMASRINETYGRMLDWLERRNARRLAAENGTRADDEKAATSQDKKDLGRVRSETHRQTSVRIWTIAALALTTYVGIRRRRH